jgi:hypothetical protein
MTEARDEKRNSYAEMDAAMDLRALIRAARDTVIDLQNGGWDLPTLNARLFDADRLLGLAAGKADVVQGALDTATSGGEKPLPRAAHAEGG